MELIDLTLELFDFLLILTTFLLKSLYLPVLIVSIIKHLVTLRSLFNRFLLKLFYLLLNLIFSLITPWHMLYSIFVA